jgi:disulfide oxidoreductase YuzD
MKIKWSKHPDKHDYPAASSYLNIIYDNETTKKILKKLKKSSIHEFKAKDIFRASNISLPVHKKGKKSHIEKDVEILIKKIKKHKKISPILLVRDQSNGKVIIADGYHRLWSVYTLDEKSIIPCKIVNVITFK